MTNPIAKKRFGQNFLIDLSVVQHIVKTIAPQAEDRIIEIGPGYGALTIAILPLIQKMTVIELDRDLIPLLTKQCETLGTLEIYQADALRFDFGRLYVKQPLRIIGNLPYNISTPLLFHLFEYKSIIQDMHFMLQKEVVDRLTAETGSGTYNRLSVMAQYHCKTEFCFSVSPHAFKPVPKVESAIVRLCPYQDNEHQTKNFPLFESIVRHAFMHRRKTLKNNLSTFANEAQLKNLGIDPQSRAQNLSVKDYIALADGLSATCTIPS
ncbi:MAG: 16S rRNA (adenine(1518)-N(6)/adenine(1519)-N(6))-dimethyltransferase RsmA [Gammaproteobacteria bacterium]